MRARNDTVDSLLEYCLNDNINLLEKNVDNPDTSQHDYDPTIFSAVLIVKQKYLPKLV
jgi:hypothetical protein